MVVCDVTRVYVHVRQYLTQRFGAPFTAGRKTNIFTVVVTVILHIRCHCHRITQTELVEFGCLFMNSENSDPGHHVIITIPSG